VSEAFWRMVRISDQKGEFHYWTEKILLSRSGWDFRFKKGNFNQGKIILWAVNFYGRRKFGMAKGWEFPLRPG